MSKKRKKFFVFILTLAIILSSFYIFLLINTNVNTTVVQENNWNNFYEDLGDDAVNVLCENMNINEQQAIRMLDNPDEYYSFIYKTTIDNNLPFPIFCFDVVAINFTDKIFRDFTPIINDTPKIGLIKSKEQKTYYNSFLVEKSDYENNPNSTKNCVIFISVMGIYIVLK